MLLALSSVLCLAQPQQVLSDDAHRVLASCGKPLTDTTKLLPDTGGSFARILTYKGIKLRFVSYPNSPEKGFGFITFERGGIVRFKRSEAVAYLPCLKAGLPVAVQSATAAMPNSAAPQVDAGSGITGGEIGAFLLFSLVVLLYAIAKYGQGRAWRNRPSRLCIACNSVRQPQLHKNGHFFCPVCQADHPIPLDSPAARERLARK